MVRTVPKRQLAVIRGAFTVPLDVRPRRWTYALAAGPVFAAASGQQ